MATNLNAVAMEAYDPDHAAFPSWEAYSAIIDATVTTLRAEVDA